MLRGGRRGRLFFGIIRHYGIYFLGLAKSFLKLRRGVLDSCVQRWFRGRGSELKIIDITLRTAPTQPHSSIPPQGLPFRVSGSSSHLNPGPVPFITAMVTPLQGYDTIIK